jgi:hypothetical protein
MQSFEDVQKEFERMVENISELTGAPIEEIEEEINKAESMDDLLIKATEFMDRNNNEE